MAKTAIESTLTPSPQLMQMVARTLRHEVGDLLQTVYSAVALLRARLPIGGENERRILSDLHAQAEVCKFKLDAIQDLTCPITVNCSPINLSEMVGSLASRLGPRFPKIQLLLETPQSVGILADGQRLNQVGYLLLVNAFQAAERQVRVRLASEGRGLVEWTIAHDGPGANAEQMSWLTKPFSTTHFAQFGLGLALARRVMELHGGAAIADNPAEGGFRMVLQIPTGP